ncbi:efflux RND transporter periplasmic adaptor subunit [Singulisphaera rosea]
MRTHLLLTMFAAAGVVLSGCGQDEPVIPPTKPPTVVVSAPITDEITDFEEFTGRTDAIFSVDVRARVTGYLDKVQFKDGDEVKEGDLLFEIDPRPYAADLARNESNILQGIARLNRLDADLRRVKNLYSKGGVSREEFDRVTGDRAEAEAAVGIAKANHDLAKLNVTFTRITAPISGRLSRRLIDPGNLVKADDTILTSIVSQDPIYVYFDMDERTMLKIRRLIREGKVKSIREAQVPVLIGLSDEDGYPHKGEINFSDNKIDPNTGTLRVRGIIANPLAREGATVRVLSPGLFAKVHLPIGSPHKEILVPEEAIGTDQGRKYLFVVKDEKRKPAKPKDAKSEKGETGHAAKEAPVAVATSEKAEKGEPKKADDGIDHVVVDRTVTVGVSHNGYRVVTKGLDVNELVIVSGQQRVRPGAKVEPRLKADPSQTPGKTASLPGQVRPL